MGELRSRLIRIGNSRGLRLPRSVIEQAGLEDDVTITVGEGEVVIRPLRHPRAGWEEALQHLGPPEEDLDLQALRALPTEFDEAEWTW